MQPLGSGRSKNNFSGTIQIVGRFHAKRYLSDLGKFSIVPANRELLMGRPTA
jgi:hypothetical protein